VSVLVETFGTAKVGEAAIAAAVTKVFDLSPRAIIETLQLKNPSIGRPPPMGISAAKNFPGRRPTRWKLC